MHIFQAATMYSIFGSGSFVKQNKKPVNPEILSKQKLVNHNILSKAQMRQKAKTMYYIHKDHLGSYETVTNNRGELVEKLSFDPWGRRRNADTWAYENTPIRYLFDRGFTQHEHLDAFGLVNMNGRVYDPWLGSFLSPDPILQAPANSQNYNRYSYAFNNPLKFVDPSGYKMALPAIIDILWQSSHGGTWNQSSGISLFESDSDAQEFVEDNIESLLPSGDDGQVRNIVKVHDNNGNSYHYDKSTGQVWNSETVSFQYGTEFMSNQKVYYDDGTMADWFLQLKEVEIVEKKTKIKGSTGGGITFGEADGHHKWGNGQPLYVDLDKLDFGDVRMSRFDNPEFHIERHPGVYVRLETSDYVNSNQALVYGTIGIVKIGDNTIMAMPDTYNFDLKLKEGTFIRDFGTILGKQYAGYGTPFPIYFRGTTTLP